MSSVDSKLATMTTEGDAQMEWIRRHVTRELLQKVFQTSERTDDVFIKDFKLSKAVRIGHLSIPVTCEVTMAVGQHESVEHLFIKMNASDDVTAILTQGETDVFKKEVNVYKNIVPALIQFQHDLGVDPIVPSLPKYYYDMVRADVRMIIMDDLGQQGYRVPYDGIELDFPHCAMVMKEIARFHALSYVMKGKEPEKMKQKFDCALVESFYNLFVMNKLMPWVQEILSKSVNVIKSATDDKTVIKAAENLAKLDIQKTFLDLVKPIEPFAVLCHGDLWYTNIMFRYDTDDQSPKGIKFLDLQMLRYAPPTVDLARFMISSTTRSFRNAHIHDLLGLYHAEFKQCLAYLGVDFPEFTRDVLNEMYKNSVMMGILSEFLFLQNHKVPMKTELPQHVLVQKRLLDDVEEALEWGIL